MITETQTLATTNSSVRDFLTEIGKISQEFDAIKPPGYHFSAVRVWRRERDVQIAEIVKKYAKPEEAEALVTVAQSLAPSNTEVLPVASRQLIKQTCMLEEARKRHIRVEFKKIYSLEKRLDRILVKFIEVISEKGIRISSFLYDMKLNSLSVFTDLDQDKPLYFTAEKIDESVNGWVQLKNVEFHFHSEEEAKFLWG